MGRLLLTVMILAWAVPISMLVNRIVPDPYMDEIFHVPQAQRYCKGDFETWDPMITTLPGLYFVSLAYIAPLFPWVQLAGIVSSFQELCSTTILRSLNIALAVICCLLFYDIFIELRPNTCTKYATRWAFVFSLYPLHWFFTFLFYTDVGSTTAVMAMYLACLKRSYWLSALLGCLAIIFRQTNVVWMAFVACIGVMHYTEKLGGEYTVEMQNNLLFNPPSESSDVNSKAVHTYLRHRQNVISKKISTSTVSEDNLHHTRSKYSGVVGELHVLAYNLWWLKWGILTNFFPFLLVLMAFSAFVIYNGSIVLGAKDAHAVSTHFAQILYFGLASAAALAPLHFNIDQVVALHQSFKKGRTKFIICCVLSLAAAFVCVRFFSPYSKKITSGINHGCFQLDVSDHTRRSMIKCDPKCRFKNIHSQFCLAHPYLLADNRHYPFYIWRRVIQAHWLMKYLLIPLYVYSWWSILHVVGKAQKKIWLLLFFFAAVGVLVPAPLIEFRYYTVPFYLIILHSPIKEKTWLLIGMQYIIVNLVTMSLFLFRPFHWDHDSGTQRFIW